MHNPKGRIARATKKIEKVEDLQAKIMEVEVENLHRGFAKGKK